MNETPDNIRRKADDLARCGIPEGETYGLPARPGVSEGEIYRTLHRIAAQIEGAGKENGVVERECLKRHDIEY